MERDFYLASIPDQFRVLGFALRPLSLGHVIILHRIESPYVMGGRPDIEALASAVFVCSQTYKDAINGISDPQRDLFMLRWHDKLSGRNRLLVRCGLRKERLIDFGKESDAFQEYLSFHTKIPNYSYKDGDRITMDCPAAQIVKVSLMRDMGFSESELLDRSWALCLWDHITLKALAGHVDMVYEDTIQESQDIGKKLAEMVAQGKIRNGPP